MMTVIALGTGMLHVSDTADDIAWVVKHASIRRLFLLRYADRAA